MILVTGVRITNKLLRQMHDIRASGSWFLLVNSNWAVIFFLGKSDKQDGS